MSNFYIDYGKLIDDAMHIIVRQALGYVKNGSLPGRHHFFISFLTSHPGVEISDSLREKYPEEMTIVLQHQFEELTITDTYFSVVLSFDNIKEKIQIPFDSLIAFADPSVKFGLQFSHAEENAEDLEILPEDNILAAELEDEITAQLEESEPPTKGRKKKKKKDLASLVANNVVDIDAFRKK